MAAYVSFPEAGGTPLARPVNGERNDEGGPAAAPGAGFGGRPARGEPGPAAAVHTELQVFVTGVAEVQDALPGSVTYQYSLESHSTLPTFRTRYSAVTRRGADFALLRHKLRAFCPGACATVGGTRVRAHPVSTLTALAPPSLPSRRRGASPSGRDPPGGWHRLVCALQPGVTGEGKQRPSSRAVLVTTRWRGLGRGSGASLRLEHHSRRAGSQGGGRLLRGGGGAPTSARVPGSSLVSATRRDGPQPGSICAETRPGRPRGVGRQQRGW